MSFENLGLSRALLRAVREQGYRTATPIQIKAIATAVGGRDVMGCAQTGTGKTAAFALPTLQRLFASHPLEQGNAKKRRRHRRPIRSLILAPTRELAAQIEESFTTYGKFTEIRNLVIYGGVNQNPQVRALQAGVDVLVATPGRLLDLMNQGHVDLKKVEILILDEADQMLDMGFLPDLRKIVAQVPRRRQTLMFSATMPKQILELAELWLHEPKHVQVAPAATPIELVQQSVYLVAPQHKGQLLAHYLHNTPCTRTLVFARTKRGADRICKQLIRAGIPAVAIHGDKSQAARNRALERFKSRQPPVLVATDIAARGLDIDDVSHVINYELPEVPEVYVHRIGRTARAGSSGEATSFCGIDEKDRLRRIERLIRQSIVVRNDQPQYADNGQRARKPAAKSPAPRDGQEKTEKTCHEKNRRFKGARRKKAVATGQGTGGKKRRRPPAKR